MIFVHYPRIELFHCHVPKNHWYHLHRWHWCLLQQLQLLQHHHQCHLIWQLWQVIEMHQCLHHVGLIPNKGSFYFIVCFFFICTFLILCPKKRHKQFGDGFFFVIIFVFFLICLFNKNMVLFINFLFLEISSPFCFCLLYYFMLLYNLWLINA